MRAPGRRLAAVTLGLAVYATLASLSLRGQSPTFDEVAHLPAGYMHLTRADYRLVPEQPPLVKVLAALPLLAMRLNVPATDPSWARRRHYEFGRRFLFEWNDGQRLVIAGRQVMVVSAAALIALMSWLAWSRWGPTVGALTLCLGALHPDLLAHGPLVTTDVAMTLFWLAALSSFQRALHGPFWSRALLSGLCLGAALATKFSALILLPLLLALGMVDAVRSGAAWAALGRERWLRLVSLLGVTMPIALFVVWGAYAFQARVTPDPAVNEVFALQHERPANALVWQAALVAQRLHLLPDPYLFGFLRVARHSESRRAFLFGERSDEGWWYYFPATLVLKTPIPLLLLIGLAFVYAGRDWRRHLPEALLWLPPLVYLLLSMGRNLNIGHRHILPVLPFLLWGAARAAAAVWRDHGPAARACIAILFAWYAASTLRAHPHYLAYFNELVRPGGGHHYLVDSNLDWGQDLPGLKAYLDRQRVERIKLSYFGTAEPAYYGIPGPRLPGYPPVTDLIKVVRPGDLLAVSATNLQAVYLTDDPDAERLMRKVRLQEPIAHIGHSILIYRADFHWRRP